MKKWNDLSMRERSAFIRVGVSNGIYNIDNIHKAYNEYSDGGFIDSSEDNKSKLEILHPEIYKSQQERARLASERRKLINEQYKKNNSKSIERQEAIDREKDLVMSSLNDIANSNKGLAKGYKEAGNTQQQNTLNTWRPFLNTVDLGMNAWQILSGNPIGFSMGMLTNGLQLGDDIATEEPLTKDVISLGMDGIGLLGAFNILKPLSFRRGNATYTINTDRVADVTGKGYSVFDSASDIYDIGKAVSSYNKTNPELIFKPFTK